MANAPEFDLQTAHRYFSADCFNRAWELIEKAERTSAEEQQMIRLNQASIWHWTQREDCTDRNLSIGYWQASRIYAVLGEAENAQKYAQLSLDRSSPEEPFYRGYAYEALARAAAAGGNRKQVKEYGAEARRLAELVQDEEERRILLDDLVTILIPHSS